MIEYDGGEFKGEMICEVRNLARSDSSFIPTTKPIKFICAILR